MALSDFLSRFFVPADAIRRRQEELVRKTPAPTFWLFGKTGTGKSSIVKYLTDTDNIAIGEGYRPCTTHSAQYDYPSVDCPALRFLDTRGLGEVNYDPQEDIQAFDAIAHAMIVTVPLLDFAQEAVLTPLRKIRAERPKRPVVLVLTTLHRAIPGRQHPPYPFEENLEPSGLLDEWARPMAEQRERFAGLVDAVVPVDLTQADDGFDDPDYGGPKLQATLAELLPDAQRQAFRSLAEVVGELKNLYWRRAMPYVVGYSALAGAAAAFPIPYLDIPIVTAVQGAMVHEIAKVYDVPSEASIVMSAAGSALVSRLALRELLKVIPVIGGAASVASASASTLALGRACCFYFAEIRDGHVPSRERFAEILRGQGERPSVTPPAHDAREKPPEEKPQ